MLAAAALDPRPLYTTKIATHPTALLAVTLAIKKLASSPSEASLAIDQFTKIFSQRQKLFGSIEARTSALRGATSAADWWSSYGGQCKELQRIAIRIVSQCNSSSGCERNWSTFALVHTKLRARLGYEKLEKLVYVHYNLKLYIQQFEAETSQQKEIDPYSMMMDVALFDENNPIMDWFCNSRSESWPILDEYDEDDDDWTAPGSFLIEELQMNETDVAAFKRELCFGRNGTEKKRKRQLEEEELFDDDFHSDSSHGSPTYAESNDSSSASEDEGDGDDGNDRDGSSTGILSELAKVVDGGGSGSRACMNSARHSSDRIGKPSTIRPRSTRKKKPTLKSINQL